MLSWDWACAYSPPLKRVIVLTKTYKLRRVRLGVFRCGPLLSAGTASASSRNPLCGVFRHVLRLRLLAPSKTFVPAGQGIPRQLLHRTKKIGLYFRGVNGPSLQTTIVIVKASYKVLLPNTMLAKEIHGDSCGNSGQSETPQNDSSRRLTGHPRKA